MNAIELIGFKVIQVFSDISGVLRVFLESSIFFLARVFSFRLRGREIIHQMYVLGVQSLPVVAFALAFVGLMLILEFSFHMRLVLQQDSLVPAFSTVLMLRELGPVICSLLLASRVGAGIAAEVGTMKVTDQLDVLKLFSIDPIEFLGVPRWIACVFAAVTLSVISVAIAMFAGATIASANLHYTVHEFANTMFTFARFSDLTTCIIKAAVFGTIIPMIAMHHGLKCSAGSEGVGNAATSAVVQSSLAIIIADFVLTYLLYAI